MNDCRHNRGTTLLEMLLALGLSSLMISLLLMIYSSSSGAYQKLAAYCDVQYTARSVIEQIGDDVRGAAGIEIMASGSELEVTTYNNDLIRYRLENSRLYRLKTTSMGTAKVPIADQVSTVSFAGSNGLITAKVEITMDQTSYQLSRVFGSRMME